MTKVASLFAGVGMFDLAAVACGCEIAWSVELDDWNRALLEKRFPDAIHRKDVTEVGGDLPSVDGMIGGFPCQDISNAGRREGISGKRSGLWGEFARLIGVYEPEWVVIENVSALKRRGLNTVLDDLHKLHYDATWDCIPAIAVGAPHLRDRIWIVATKRGTVTAPAFFPAWEHGSLPTDLPRAGVMCAEGVFYDTPRAEVGACKKAMKRGRPIFPTLMASDGDRGTEYVTRADREEDGTPTNPTLLGAARFFPAPEASDGTGGRVSAELGGERPSGSKRSVTLGTAVAHETVPTPSARDWKDTGEGRMGRGQLPEAVRNGEQIFPTPAANDHKGDVVSHIRNKHGWDGGERAQITSLAVLAKNGFQQATPEQIEEARSTPPLSGKRVESWPTPHGFPKDGQARNPGPSGNELGRAVNEAERAPKTWPTPVASDSLGSRRSSARTEEWTSNDGVTLLDAVSEEEGIEWETKLDRLWATPKSSPSGPDFAREERERSGGDDLVTQVARTLPTPRASDGDPRNRGDLIAHVKERPNSHHPGEREEGRENERRAGALNPDWVEWLMGMPVGWTNPDVDMPVLLDWASEYGLPRVSTDPTYRRQRLTAIGNALVFRVAMIPIKEAIARA